MVTAAIVGSGSFNAAQADNPQPVSDVSSVAKAPGKDICSQMSKPTTVTVELDPKVPTTVRRPSGSYVADGKGGCLPVTLVIGPLDPEGPTAALKRMASATATVDDAVFSAYATTYRYIDWTCSYTVWGEIAGGVRIAALDVAQDYEWFNLYNILTWWDRTPWAFPWVPTGGKLMGWSPNDTWPAPTVGVSRYIPNSRYPIELRSKFGASYHQNIPILGSINSKSITATVYSKGGSYSTRCRITSSFQ